MRFRNDPNSKETYFEPFRASVSCWMSQDKAARRLPWKPRRITAHPRALPRGRSPPPWPTGEVFGSSSVFDTPTSGKDSAGAVSAESCLSAADSAEPAVARCGRPCGRENIAKDMPPSCWGGCPSEPRAKTCLWLHAVSVGEVNLLAPLLNNDRAGAAGLGMRHLDHHHDRHDAGEEEISETDGFLLPAGFFLGRQCGHAADPARRARAGRVGIVAQLDPRGETSWRPGRRHQWAIGRKELPRLSPDPPAGGRAAPADRPVGRAGRNLRRAVPRARRPAGSGSRHRLDEVRRRRPTGTIRPRGGWPRWPASPTTTSSCWPAARRSRKRPWRWRRSAN